MGSSDYAATPAEASAEDVIEVVSDKVHARWMENKLAAGVTSRCLESGEELMVPYAKLSEAAKDLDRGSVRATVEALKAAGFKIVK